MSDGHNGSGDGPARTDTRSGGAPPRIVATIGLHGSASTWVFNAARELMIAAFGEAQVVALYAEAMDELPDEATRAGRSLVIKSHHGSAGFDAWLLASQPRIILSIRDPRDAALSMSQRFNVPLNHTAQWVVRDCKRLANLAAQGHLLLRYEHRFFEDAASPARVADALGLAVTPAVTEAIAARYHTDAMRSFTRTLTDLPPDRVIVTGQTVMDRVTQIHRTHIGDARSGKWRDLPPQHQDSLTQAFGPFLDRFGYSR